MIGERLIMTHQQLFEGLKAELLEKMLSVELLHDFHHLNDQALRLFVCQFYPIIKKFPHYLTALMCKTSDEKLRLIILDNLIDEMGGIDNIKNRSNKEAHYKLFAHFGYALELSDTDLEANNTLRPYTSHFLKTVDNIFDHTNIIKGIGALTFGIESIYPFWIDHVYQGLLAQKRFSDEALYHFKLHTAIDLIHGQVLEEGISSHLKTKKDRELLLQGAMETVNSFKDFFIGLSQDIQMVLPTEKQSAA
jgi:pyrroloquinoline-quinone synthase